MNEKLITALLGILLALGGWNLSQTFKLSNDMTEVKVKIEHMEQAIVQGGAFKKSNNKKKRVKKKKKIN
tara:strand:+ start:91 stop:297 length:207 start_codon:yes stop_codon:yes gene_type:complete